MGTSLRRDAEYRLYEVWRNGKSILEADACGIGFVASRRGWADRRLVDAALALAERFDHRGAPGHGAGMQLDIPWALMLDRFSRRHSHLKNLIANREVAVGMFFLPIEPEARRECRAKVEELAELAHAPVLAWEKVDIDEDALHVNLAARRTVPYVAQALFRRPEDSTESGWFATRYLLRLALDHELGNISEEHFSLVSLSNRTIVYKGLVELSKLADFYPDLRRPEFSSRFALFHSRYCTNTTTAWRRAQPFWSLAHNGEIATISGNKAWMEAIGRDLIRKLVEEHPELSTIAKKIRSVICSGGSDTANLDDMVIALVAGGMSMSQAILGLLPEASRVIDPASPLADFYRAMDVYLGACDGPAAIVACDGDEAVAHLDRNGLRPLWFATTKDFAIAASELTGKAPLEGIESQRILGPGETVVVRLSDRQILFNDQVRSEVGRRSFPSASERIEDGGETALHLDLTELTRQQRAFGMTQEDIDVLMTPLVETGKPAVGSMGDDTPPASMLDAMPRRLEDYFALRFAQETSPPIDPIRDAWVFDTHVMLGDRSGLWTAPLGPIYRFPSRILAIRQAAWLETRDGVRTLRLHFDSSLGSSEIERRLDSLEEEAIQASKSATVLILSDREVSLSEACVPILRAATRIHSRLVREGIRHRVGLVADAGVWDVQHCALLLSVGADAVVPWLGSATAGAREASYLKGIRSGVIEAMSMMGVTPASAYCGARLIEAICLDPDFLEKEFPGVPGHLAGIGADVLNEEWFSFHQEAFADAFCELPDVGEFRHTKSGRPHHNNAEIVRSLHLASGFSSKMHRQTPGSPEAYREYATLVRDRQPTNLLDCIRLKTGDPISLDEVEPTELILWRFMTPGMSEGALSEPAHRSVARGMNLLHRYCRLKLHLLGLPLPPGIGPFANSGEGGFDKGRIGKSDGNASVQYAGGRFTITPMTASRAKEAEVKFAQGAKPGKGGQLPGKKVGNRVANQRGCEPGYELLSPPINHNLYSIEDVKLMLESWRHLNPDVNCALKYVSTFGVEMVCVGGVNAGANRLHLSDGCGGTGAAKRVDQKHAGVPVVAMLPRVQDMLIEEGTRHLVEISVDGGIQGGEQALKLFLLGADRVGFGTSALIALGCSMLRKCHLAGADPTDPTGKRRLGCSPGVATQDPVLVAKFTGKGKHIARYLRYVAEEVRELMATHGIRNLAEVIGQRDLLDRKPSLTGKSASIRFESILGAPFGYEDRREYATQTSKHMPQLRLNEHRAAEEALGGCMAFIREKLTNADRCVGMGAAGILARKLGDQGLTQGEIIFEHEGAAGHFYASYIVEGMFFRLKGVAADSCFTAAYGGKLVILPEDPEVTLTLVGNTFGYGARGGKAFIAGRAGNRFGICIRKNHEGGGPKVVVEGVEANAFQYMTGGTAVVLGPIGFNLGAGMTGGKVFLFDPDLGMLNTDYVQALSVQNEDVYLLQSLLEEHLRETDSKLAKCILRKFDPSAFRKVVTSSKPEVVEY